MISAKNLAQSNSGDADILVLGGNSMFGRVPQEEVKKSVGMSTQNTIKINSQGFPADVEGNVVPSLVGKYSLIIGTGAVITDDTNPEYVEVQLLDNVACINCILVYNYEAFSTSSTPRQKTPFVVRIVSNGASTQLYSTPPPEPSYSGAFFISIIRDRNGTVFVI